MEDTSFIKALEYVRKLPENTFMKMRDSKRKRKNSL